MGKEPTTTKKANPANTTTARGKLVRISREDEPVAEVNPDHVTAVTQEGTVTTVHLSGGSLVQVTRPQAEVREALGI